MDLRGELLHIRGKEHVLEIVTWVGTDRKRLSQLMHIFLYDDYRASQQAGCPLGDIGKNHPELILPYLHKMIDRMLQPAVHRSVKRNVVRILQFMDIPEKHQGNVMNVCFELLGDPKEAIAVRVFSMTVLDNLSKIYPELRQELIAIIEDEMEREPTAAFKSRAKKILARK